MIHKYMKIIHGHLEMKYDIFISYISLIVCRLNAIFIPLVPDMCLYLLFHNEQLESSLDDTNEINKLM